MSSETTLVATQLRLRQWAEQIRDCNNRPEAIKITQDQFRMLMQVTPVGDNFRIDLCCSLQVIHMYSSCRCSRLYLRLL